MARIPALDISVWDEGIDLNEWKRKHGIGAVIVKCGGNEGRRYADRCFADHMCKAQEAGLPAGVYYYTTSTTVDSAIADADHCCAFIVRNYDLQLPVFMDVEDDRQFQLSKRALTDVIKAFCDRVQEHGYRAGLYTGGYAWSNNMYPEELRQYCTWIASWQASWPSYVGKIDAWQQGTKRLGDGRVFFDDVSGCQDFDWIEDYVIQGGSKVPTTRTGWAETLETCQDPADYAYCTCKVYSCGYSQPKRDHLTIERLKAGTAETDCSYGVGWWLWKGGYLDENPAFHTAIEREYLQEHGYDLINANAGFVKMQRNDVLWRPGHTALYIGDGLQAEALRTERHDAGYDGSTPGDQDQGETVVRKLTLDWDYVIRKKEQSKPTPDKETNMINMGFYAFDSDPTEHFWDGQHLHAIANPDEKKAIIDFFALNGIKLDPTPKPFGTDTAPFGARLNDVLSRGAEFRGFERFNSHPSTKKIVLEIVTNAVKTLTTNIQAMLEKK